ncbi:hypothetical protein RND71_008257 [Anisodus tanguticus]|uniref:Uncharacterized protein n=1 Tax=Anisodus tanguticus TaxID=243964 RepID=A0AAE1SNS7_9SOLA|nr:hypothetical protein RND71_008257 [Anisodus tanguticus]
MLEAPKFAGLIDLNENHDNYGITQIFYHKLGEGSNMSIDSYGSLQMSDGGGSVAMSMDNSSVGSNGSHTHILNHQGLKSVRNYSVVGNVNRGRVSQGLEYYDEWTIDLRKLTYFILLFMV